MAAPKRTRVDAFSDDESNDVGYGFESILPDMFSGSTVDIILHDAKFRVARYALESVKWFNEALLHTTVLNLPRDSSESMRIVLQILHHQYRALPENLDLCELFQLATICDKYDLGHLVRPHVLDREWIPHEIDLLSWHYWPLILSTFEKPKSTRLNSFLDKIAARMRFESEQWHVGLMAVEDVDAIDEEQMIARRFELWRRFVKGCKEKMDILKDKCHALKPNEFWAEEYTNFGFMVIFLDELRPMAECDTVMARLQGLNSSKTSCFGKVNPVHSIAASMIRSLDI